MKKNFIFFRFIIRIKKGNRVGRDLMRSLLPFRLPQNRMIYTYTTSERCFSDLVLEAYIISGSLVSLYWLYLSALINLVVKRGGFFFFFFIFFFHWWLVYLSLTEMLISYFSSQSQHTRLFPSSLQKLFGDLFPHSVFLFSGIKANSFGPSLAFSKNQSLYYISTVNKWRGHFTARRW